MNRYKVCNWEDNRYDDSDGYLVYWDHEKRELVKVLEWTTRFGSVPCPEASYPMMKDAPDDVKQAFREWGCKTAARLIFTAAEFDRNEPNSVRHGDPLTTTRICKPRGKPQIPAGTKGEVFWSGAYGTFYRNSYNKPGRGNIRVGLRLLDGSRVFVALEACARDVELEAIEDIEERMKVSWDAGTFGIKGLTECRAWLTTDWTK